MPLPSRPKARSTSLLRSRTNFVGILLTLTAALVPGAAVFASPNLQIGCTATSVAPTARELADIKVIVVGVVRSGNNTGAVRIEPELFLKGAASREPITLQKAATNGDCVLARLNDGDRVIAFLRSSENHLTWPPDGQMFLLYEGVATNGGNTPVSLSESELIENVRRVTGQFAVPAANSAEAAHIHWVGTVLPVGGGLLVILAIALGLMGLWHRIDPS